MVDLLIPKRPEKGCPNALFGCVADGCPSTCYCEDHCSYERCALYDPPSECLAGTNSKWAWDSKSMYWTAQANFGMHQ